MEKLTLANRKVLSNSSAVLSGDLFLYMNGYGMQEIFDLLIDPAKTKKITYTQINGDKVVYNGYTKLTAVRDEGNDLITAVLKKAVE